MNTYGPFPSGDKAEAYKRALIDYAEEDAELIDWTVMLLSSVD